MPSMFFCFAYTLLASLIKEAHGQCRYLRFTSSPIHGYRLDNHTIRAIDVVNEHLCEVQCFLEPNCVSYNFNKTKQESGKHKCDLNNATFDHENPGDLEKNKQYLYRGAENSCEKKPCKNNATCQAGFTERDYQCLCIAGYEGHDRDVDIDECTKGTYRCEGNTSCHNTPGSYKCTCKDGYPGNGTNCTDIDECTIGTHRCDVNAVCNNILGSYNCTCKDGFHGNGTNCTDIDECTIGIHGCDVNAVCNNILGSYNCTCKDGFHGNGKNCTDIDECTIGIHGCDVNAVCNNILGSYNCTCKDGFHGNGKNCTDIDECGSGTHDNNPLGIESGKIPSSAIVASSQYSEYYGPDRGRLWTVVQGSYEGGWVPQYNDVNQFLQFDLGNVTMVTAVATQGLSSADWMVKSYTLAHSLDGVSFASYSDGQVFLGNSLDRNEIVLNTIDPPIIARFIQIRVKTFKGRIGMRAELYGCTDGFTKPQPLVCLEALGMQSERIPDSALRASTVYNTGSKAINGRLHFLYRSGSPRHGAWIAKTNDAFQFLEATLSDWTKVTRVAIQGRQDADHWVKSFSLSYGYDGVFFKAYIEDGLQKVFAGNNDRYTPVAHDLKTPIITRYIRIHPITWKSHVAMRAEFYGCKEGFTPPVIKCNNPLGIESGKIPSSAIVASSQFNQYYGPDRGRLRTVAQGSYGGGWLAQYNDLNQFLQFDLGNVTMVTAVATQGMSNNDWMVTSYTLAHSLDGVSFTSYGNGQVFQGNNQDRNELVGNTIDPPIIARFIQIRVKTYKGYTGMRAELYGCTDGFRAVFTNLGASVNKGPATIGSHYTGQDHDGQVTLSSGIQLWTVPYTGEYRIEAIGAAGGYGEDSILKNGGRGARMIGNFNLTKDEIIHILVGQEGSRGEHNQKTSGGGGGTFVVTASNTPLIIAGGGGGIKNMSAQDLRCDASINTTGNAGHKSPLGSGGSNGHGGDTTGEHSGGGGGGFYSKGKNSPQPGHFGNGGKGYLNGGKGGTLGGGFGGGGGLHTGSFGRGAGGGGGYSGGSGGVNEDISCGGGGGSFNIGTNQHNECCYNSAEHGNVILTFLK